MSIHHKKQENNTISLIHVYIIVNDYDLHGNACPLPPQHNVECPVLCVTNHDLCPSALAPTCPNGQSFCLDGTCQDSCEGIANACMCDMDDATANAYSNYVPCMAGHTINIEHYNKTRGTEQIRDTCAASIQLNASSSDVGVWGSNVNTPYVWAECPTPPEPYFTFREPMWIAVWAIMGIEAALLVSWHLYKTGREFTFHRAMNTAISSSGNTSIDEKISAAASTAADKTTKDINDEKAMTKKGDEDWVDSSETSSLQDSERLVFRGFNTDYFGVFVFGSVVIITILFVIFLGCIVSDYCKW